MTTTLRLPVTLVLTLTTALALVAGASAQRRSEPEELLALYDRGVYELFDERLRAFAAAPTSVETFTRAADRWMGSGFSSTRRRLVAAAVTVELAAVLSNWSAGPALMDAGRGWLSGSAADWARQWYRAAIGAALAHGDTDLVLALRDVQADAPRIMPSYREYANLALRQFPDDPSFMLFKAIAFELKSATGGSAQWFDRDAIDRHVKSLKRGRDGRPTVQLPANARMDVASAERLLRPDMADLPDVEFVAGISLRLWRVVNMFQDLQRNRVVAAEATLRLAVTYERLARPDLASLELARALDSPASPFVTYSVHFLRGRTFERADRLDDAEAAYRKALGAVPNAQAASFALAPLLVASARRLEAESLAAGALRFPLTPDPMKRYGGGDPSHMDDALARMRQELQ